ncbi:MAG: flagellar hook assembly protein FlgD [Armatimonadota bacterium]
MATSVSSISSRATVPETVQANGASFDGDAFLKLLSAQLRYQDPLEPMASPEFLAQTAQIQSVQQLREVSRQLAEMSKALTLVVASALIGKTVEIASDDGREATQAVVSGVAMDSQGVRLIAGGREVQLTSVRSIR